MLGSEYNAIIQAAIYGFAVPVIVGISIMFTTGKGKSKNESVLPMITVIAAILFVTAFVYVLMISLAMLPESFHTLEPVQFNSYDIISEFAKGIYIDYVWAFELLSLLLTIIIAGLTLFRTKSKVKSGKLIKKEGKTGV